MQCNQDSPFFEKACRAISRSLISLLDIMEKNSAKGSQKQLWIISWKCFLKQEFSHKPCYISHTVLFLKSKISWLLLSLACSLSYKHTGRRAGMIGAHKTADINKPIPHCCKPQTEQKQKTWLILCRNAGFSKTQDASALRLCGWGWGGLDVDGKVRGGQAGPSCGPCLKVNRLRPCTYIFLHSSNSTLGIKFKLVLLYNSNSVQIVFLKHMVWFKDCFFPGGLGYFIFLW